MIKTTRQSQSLSNNNLQVFKLDNDRSLQLQGINIIARQEDGYINLNQLCKAGSKDFRAWKRNKNSMAFIQALSEGGRILPPSLIKYETNSKTDQANWGHPQIAINVAQWVSPEFNVKVSKWVFELMTTGSVNQRTQ